MRVSCKGCQLKCNLEQNRKTLINLISEKNNLLDAIVVKQSQVLDHFIVECANCNKRISDGHKEALHDIFGMHSTFYYYGLEHLFINLLPYIRYGVENNELVTVSLSKDIYDKLMELLDIYGIDKFRVIFFPVKDMVIANKENGIDGLRRLLSTLLKEVESNDYKGARVIGQPSFAIGETSKEDFLKLEEVLTKAFVDMKASGLCIYDAFDYIHNRDIIDEDIIKNSFKTHSHLLYNNYLSEF